MITIIMRMTQVNYAHDENAKCQGTNFYFLACTPFLEIFKGRNASCGPFSLRHVALTDTLCNVKLAIIRSIGIEMTFVDFGVDMFCL